MTASFSKKQFLSFLIFLSIAVLMRWNTFTAPLERDEGEYAYGAWIMTKGMLPYVDTFLQKPPMIIHIYRFGMMLSDHPILPFRLLAFLSSVLVSLLVGRIVAKVLGKDYFWTGVYFNWGLLSIPAFLAFAANTEIFMILPLTIALERVLCANRNLFQSFLWGALVSIAVFTKPICAPVIFLLVFTWLGYNRESEIIISNYNKTIKNLLWMIAGAVFIAILIFIPFSSYEAINQFYTQVIVFNSHYIKSFNAWGALNLLQIEIICIIPLILLALYSAIKLEFASIVTIFCLSISMLTMRFGAFPHYAILMIPFCAVSSCIGLKILFSKFELPYPRNMLTMHLASSLIFALSIIPSLYFIGDSPDDFVWKIYQHDTNNFSGAQAIARKLNMLSPPEKKVLIAGLEPEVLWYSKRLSVSKYIIQAPLAFDTPFREKFLNDFKNEVISNPPEYIILFNLVGSYFYNQILTKKDEYSLWVVDELLQKYEPLGGILGSKSFHYFADKMQYSHNSEVLPIIVMYERK